MYVCAHIMADCGNFPKEWGVANAGDLTNLTKTHPKVALNAFGEYVGAVYNTTIGYVSLAVATDPTR